MGYFWRFYSIPLNIFSTLYLNMANMVLMSNLEDNLLIYFLIPSLSNCYYGIFPPNIFFPGEVNLTREMLVIFSIAKTSSEGLGVFFKFPLH